MRTKRVLLGIGALLIPSTGAFSLDLSLGVGLTGGSFTSINSYSMVSNGPSSGGSTIESQTPYGAFAFLDATFLQLSVGYFVADGGSSETYQVSSGTPSNYTTSDLDLDTSYLSFSALAKYPFQIGNAVLFPLLGVEYDLNLTYTDTNGNNLLSTLASPQDANQLWIKAGGGIDFSFGQFFFRPEILVGYKFLNQTERNEITTTLNTPLESSPSIVDLELGVNLMVGMRL